MENQSDKYTKSGVNISEGNRAVNLIKEKVKSTFTEGVISDIGGFSGLFSIDSKKYNKPVLVSGTDGVGTKLIVAQKTKVYDTIGIDLVAMCVNDIITCGATPLFFLDYIALGKLVPENVAKIVDGIATGCKEAMSALIGGETAEMPDLYKDDDFDLAGFAVGIVDKDNIIDGKQIKAGDMMIGVKSSGFHSNGYSLLRYILFHENKLDVDHYISDLSKTVGELLLTPTKIYVKTLNKIKNFTIKGIAHITGGGITENLPRILPDNLKPQYIKWDIPAHFEYIKQLGNVDESEMYRVFNMGIGLIIVVDKNDADNIVSNIGLDASIIGEIV